MKNNARKGNNMKEHEGNRNKTKVNQRTCKARQEQIKNMKEKRGKNIK